MSDLVVDIRGEADVVAARQAGRELARTLGLGLADQTRLATAISELTRNVVQYAGPGKCTLGGEVEGDKVTISIRVEDSGPGIADLDRAMEDGYSTGGGLGAGLPGSRRLLDELTIDSKPGGTLVCGLMRRRRR